MHPPGLAPVPIRKDATADQACEGICSAGVGNGDKIICIDAMIVIDEGQDAVFDQRESTIQGVRLAWGWLRFPAQGYPILCVRLLSIRFQDFARMVRARIGHHQKLHVAAGRAVGLIQPLKRAR